MKNTLLSILLTSISFVATYFLLSKVNNTPIDFNSIKTIPTQEPKAKQTISENKIDITSYIENPKSWEDYYKDNIDLSTDFIPINQIGEEIEKESFLELLKSGNYVPIKLYDTDNMYQLYKLGDETDDKIGKSVKTSAGVYYSYFGKENTDFPEFEFVDLNGNTVSSKSTLGKIVVVKCWFINCTVCVQEFPKLNSLYDRYEGYDDVVFVSLAFDEPGKLKKFLSKKEFRYPVVANQKDFMTKEIEVKQYPTHIIINEYGKIEKMVNNVDSLIRALDAMMNGDNLDSEI